MGNPRALTSSLRVVVVLGTTATGKTALAIRIAQQFGGEVVSADSRYFYRGMSIGTAKPDATERDGIPHHLIDIRDPREPYSLATFLDDAYAAIEDVAARGALPVVAGGTPQYLRALLEGWQVPHVPPNEALREELDRSEVSDLFARVMAVDPLSAERIGPHNKRRLIRALEVQQATGQQMSVVASAAPPPYRFHIIGLRVEREALYARIDARVHAMVAAGWLDEVRALHAAGVTPDLPSMSAHGYRELLEVISGQTTLDDAVQRTCFMIHKYVRHQETWFRRFPAVQWFDSSAPSATVAALESVRAFLAT
jgi:tRNA dimethylallyltransferase